MKKTIILFAGLLLMHQSSMAQDEPSNAKRIKISDVYLQVGAHGDRNHAANIGDFQRILPQSSLLQRDYDGYHSSWGHYYSSTGAFSMLLGFQFRDKNGDAYRSNPRLRLGLKYFSGTSLYSSYRRQDRFHVDNLVSENTGQIYPIDSVVNSSLQMRLISEQIHLDASMLFSTNPENRVTLFGGLGFTGGASIVANAEIDYFETSQLTNEGGGGRMVFFRHYHDGEGVHENHRTSTLWGASAYVPLGIDVRLGKTREFWKLLHVYYEARPSLNFTFIPELAARTSAVMQHSVGIRVGW
ncbi:MAG: hypothetical protein ACK4ND_19575 [Cytophagaceae bacterium]